MVLEALITNAPLGHDSNNKHGGEQSAAGIGPTQSCQANKIAWIKHADSLTRMIWRLCFCLSQPLITIHVVNESPSVEPRRLVGVFCLGWSTSFLLLQLWRSIHMLTICEKETVPTKTVCVQIPLCMLSLHHSPPLPVIFIYLFFCCVADLTNTHYRSLCWDVGTEARLRHWWELWGDWLKGDNTERFKGGVTSQSLDRMKEDAEFRFETLYPRNINSGKNHIWLYAWFHTGIMKLGEERLSKMER